jgi:hypothetical protein
MTDLNFDLKRATLVQSPTALDKYPFRHLGQTKLSYSDDLIPHSSILRPRDLRYLQFYHSFHNHRHFCRLTFSDFCALRILARTLLICDNACLIFSALNEENCNQYKSELLETSAKYPFGLDQVMTNHYLYSTRGALKT